MNATLKCVRHILNRLFGGGPTRWTSVRPEAAEYSHGLRIASRRYGRARLCATRLAALPRYVCILLSLILSAAADAQPAPPPLRFSLRPDALDLSRCLAQPGNVPLTLVAGDPSLEVVDWSSTVSSTPHTAEFVLTFKAPTQVGSVIACEPGDVSFQTNGVWQSLPARGDAGRALQLLPLPPASLVQAIRFRIPSRPVTGPNATGHRAELLFATLIPARVINLARDAAAISSSDAATRTSALIDGKVDEVHDFDAPASVWVMLTWPQPVEFRGLAFIGGRANSGAGVIQIFNGDGDPRASNDAGAWQNVQGRSTQPGRFRSNRFFVSSRPLQTRGLRITSTGQVARLSFSEIAVLRDLGTAPVPVPAPAFATNVWAIPKVANDRISVDGLDHDWPKERRHGFALAYDDTRLHLLYQAHGGSAFFTNTGTSVHELFFTGDALDVQLQTQAGLSAERAVPDFGDLRLLITLTNGHPVCVLFDYRVEDLLVIPVEFTSAGRTVTCDRITALAEARLASRRQPDQFTVEASVPLKAIHLDPGNLPETRGDVARIVRAKGTQLPARRQSWAEPDVLPLNDPASGAEIRPNTWGILRFTEK